MTSLVEPIRGKVARVLSTREVALNKGRADGVKTGMVFKILKSKGSAIKDPDTGEVIGSVELEKTSVKVTLVQEHLSIASTFRTRKVNTGGTAFRPSGIFGPPKWETRVETFKTDDPLDEFFARDTTVKTGDPAVQDLETSQVDGFARTAQTPPSPA